ncbi:MAG TPA: hypothetical protein VGO57_10870 [Verrucomicrobiae bacterium]|jgi:hypothetical protein
MIYADFIGGNGCASVEENGCHSWLIKVLRERTEKSWLHSRKLRKKAVNRGDLNQGAGVFSSRKSLKTGKKS